MEPGMAHRGSIAVKNDINLIAAPLTLPNGVIIPNRLVKAAMAEGIGLGGGVPRQGHLKLYQRWSEGGWGMVISGNVQIDPGHLASPHDLTIPDSPRSLAAYRKLANAVHSASSPNGAEERSPPKLIMQLSHPGLQSSSTMNFSRLPWEPAIAPCSARPDISDGLIGWIWSRAVWPLKSRRVDKVDEWLRIVNKFVRAAKVAEAAGWDGVQLHSAHGYLLAEYLSSSTNPDPQPIPDVPDFVPIRLHLLYLILHEIYQNTSRSFVKGVKLNCSDFVQGGLDEAQAAEIIRNIVSWRLVDFIEVSGGTYSQPAFAAPEKVVSSSGKTRQSLFAHFTSSILPSLPPLPDGPAILLTGGLHDRALIASSLQDKACHLVGIGRPACLNPALPNDMILNPDIADNDARVGGYSIPGGDLVNLLLGGGSSTSGSRGNGIPLVGAGVSTLWHEWQMCRLGRGLEPDIRMHWFRGFWVEEIWYEVLKGGPMGWWAALAGC